MAGPSRVYLDSNVFIIGFEFPAKISQPIQELLAALDKIPKTLVTSEITLAELLAPPKRTNDFPIDRKFELYCDLLIWRGFVDLLPVSRQILMETAYLRQNWPFKLPDAIHVVSAQVASCAFFMSANSDMKQLPGPMRLVRPDAAGVATVLGALNG